MRLLMAANAGIGFPIGSTAFSFGSQADINATKATAIQIPVRGICIFIPSPALNIFAKLLKIHQIQSKNLTYKSFCLLRQVMPTHKPPQFHTALVVQNRIDVIAIKDARGTRHPRRSPKETPQNYTFFTELQNKNCIFRWM